jgi:hypothetical protein
MLRSEFDHLVVGCADLDAGARWLEGRLGVAIQPGGRHVSMGTHNALLKLGPRCYLELIAIDPAASPPARPRWFSLDDPATQQSIAPHPRLLTWAVRCDSLAQACARVPDLGEILPMSRGLFSWKIAVPEDGSLPWSGMLPAGIQWSDPDAEAPGHPCDVLEDRGCEFISLALSHPAAVLGTGGIVGLFRELRIVGPVELKPGPRYLAAVIRTPCGEVVIDSGELPLVSAGAA